MNDFPFQERDNQNVIWYPHNLKRVDEEEIWRERRSRLTTEKGLGLYVHIPFCKFICPFCHFSHYRWSENREVEYVRALMKEIDLYSNLSLFRENKIASLYFGGGTPTALTTTSLVSLLNHIMERFRLSQKTEIEISMEANPLTVNKDKLSKLLDMGLNRISFGIQSFKENLLRILRCPHKVKDGIRAITIAKEVGFKNISIDLIYRIPTQSIEEWKEDLSTAVEYELSHFSIYSLLVVPGTSLYDEIKGGKCPPQPNQTTDIEMFKFGRKYLENHGYKQYSISSFEKNNKKCLNLIIVQEAPQGAFLGFGAGAFEFANDYFSCKVQFPEDYVQRIKNDSIPYLMGVYVSKKEKMARYMILGVRCLEISKEGFRKMFGVEIKDVYGDIISDLKKWDLAKENDSMISLTERGMIYINNIAKMFYTDENKGLSQPIEMDLKGYLKKRTGKARIDRY